MKHFLVLAVLLSTVCVVSSSFAITVDVNGRSGPWSTSLNPSFSYGVPVGGTPNSNWLPTVVYSGGVNWYNDVGTMNTSSTGLPIIPGDTLTITWLNGNVCAGANGSVWTSGANGNSGWFVYNTPSDAAGTPAQYIPSDQFPMAFMQLMGVFADSSGVIVGNPFKLGNGPVTVSIPNGSSHLQMGFIDGWYNDNFATLQVSVTEAAAPVPIPPSVWLLGAGLVGLVGLRRKFGKR